MPKQDQACWGFATLVVFVKPTVKVEGAYQASEEDIEEAIKGLEKFLSVASVASTAQGVHTEPTEFVAAKIEGGTMDPAAEAAIDGIKKLAEARKKLNEVGWAKVIYPREYFRFQCIFTRGCQDGEWVVTDREFVFERVKRGTPPEATFNVPQEVVDLEKELPHILGQARSWAIQQNAAAYRKAKDCREACERVGPGSTWQPPDSAR